METSNDVILTEVNAVLVSQIQSKLNERYNDPVVFLMEEIIQGLFL